MALLHRRPARAAQDAGELALLPVIESAFEPYAYSRARASGLWQFISDTGRRFGLKQDWWYDGRRDPIEATRAALDYLQALHDEFDGDWLLAIAAYNCGELAVSRAIERNQRARQANGFLAPEAARPRPAAMCRNCWRCAAWLPTRPATGSSSAGSPMSPTSSPISTGGQIDLKVVADIAGVSVEDLYELNPAFHRWATDPTGPYRLLVPADAAEGLQQTLAAAHARAAHARRALHRASRRHRRDHRAHFATKPEVIRELNDLGASDLPVIDTALRVPSRNIELPAKAARAAMLVDSPPRLRRRRGRRPNIHVVRRGDTLYALAQRLGTDVQTLAQSNGLQPGDRLHAGQRLRVGGSRSLVADAAPGAGRSSSGTATLASSDAGRRMTYIVRRGDTLYGIARLLQVTVNELMGWNGMSGGHSLKPGQALVAFVKTRSSG